jgi:metallo-beta-lactamase family protein
LHTEVLAWLRTTPVAPERTFITHGEPAAADALQLRIQDELGWPGQGDQAEL